MGRYLCVSFTVIFLFAETLHFCLGGNSTLGCIEQERQALLNFKQSFTDSTSRLSSWKGYDCCQSDNVTCSNDTGHVVKLDLRNPSYALEAQEVHPSLLQLEYLSYLDLSGNNFQCSPIPLFFGSMKEMRFLSLFDANFRDKIPNNLDNLTNLRHLDLSYNSLLTEDISWISQLSSLENLSLNGLYLGKVQNLFQVLEMLPSLSQIQLMSCGLNDLQSHQLVSATNLSRVQDLYLAYNELQEEAPVLTLFQFLDLSYNNLTSRPSWLAKFKNLKVLGLAGNKLSGAISDALRNMISMTILDISGNNLDWVPSWFGELKSLLYLNLTSNNFGNMESFPLSLLGNFCHLEELYLAANKFHREAFQGNEPFGCIRYDLETLDLSYNEFNGGLPTWLGKLESLMYLYLGPNFFHGPIPFSVEQLPNLTQLLLAHNQLNRLFPIVLDN